MLRTLSSKASSIPSSSTSGVFENCNPDNPVFTDGRVEIIEAALPLSLHSTALENARVDASSLAELRVPRMVSVMRELSVARRVLKYILLREKKLRGWKLFSAEDDEASDGADVHDDMPICVGKDKKDDKVGDGAETSEQTRLDGVGHHLL